MILRVVLAEDNGGFVESLLKILSEIKEIEVVFIAENGKELLKAVRNFRPEIVITDIDMPEMTGLEAACIIRQELPDTEIIFITSYDVYIKEAISIYASDYIEKPLDNERLNETLNRLIRKFGSVQTQFQLYSESGVKFVNANDIYMIEAFRKKSIVYTSDGDFIVHHSLKEVEDMFTHRMFFKSSRSYIINIQKVASILPQTRTSFRITFRDKDFTAQLSKELIQELRERLKD